MARTAVPFIRELKQGSHGKDVIALQRALRAAKIRRKRATGAFGTRTFYGVERFQQRHGLVVDGVVGRHTWGSLQRFFDGYDLWLVKQIKTAPPPTSVRDKIVRAAMFAYYNRAEMHYVQRRPMSDMAPPPNVPNYTDCSQFATWAYKSAGAPDPNGMRYDGYGSTYTMRSRGTRVGSARIGDLVFYSYPDHVAIYVGGGKVVSMGSEPGPYLLSYAYRRVSEIRSYVG